MPQSLSELYVHLVFSTKHRRPSIRPEIEASLYAYIAEILYAECRSPASIIGGENDHLHVLYNQSRSWSVADTVRTIKSKSSKWIKMISPEFSRFYWQLGYGAFSVSKSVVPAVETYIANQKNHHRNFDFQTEYRRLLKRHGVAYDERYVWD